jgi:2-keto-3-deoxy-L-rhamnonate aldolase RhmA
MATVRNAARERLDAGELALGVILRQARTVDIAPIMQSCGYDWLFLDLEHNSMDLDTAVQIAVGALGAGIAPVARVPAGQLWLATRFLDGGGLGVVVPHVDTPEEAHKIAGLAVSAARAPFGGGRSAASRLRQGRAGRDVHRHQRRHVCRGDAGDSDRDRQCRRDRRRPRH